MTKKIILVLFLKIFGIKKLVADLLGGNVSGSVNIFIQILAILAQFGNAFLSVVPDEWKAIVAAGIGLIQAVLAKIGIDKNPDGTDVRLPYTPK